MVEIVKNKWRPFIKLKSIADVKTKETVDIYFDVTKRPTIVAGKDRTIIFMGNNEYLEVIDKPEEIIKAVEEMIEAEADSKRAEAEVNAANTMARVLEFKKKLDKGEPIKDA